MKLRLLGKVTESGNSPTLYDTDQDMCLIQGWVVDDSETLAQLALPGGEWHGAGPSVEAGEDLRWLPRRLASGIALPGNDFWLLDERTAMFNHFSGDGVPLGQEITDDAAVVELCRAAFDCVWSVAVPNCEYEI